MPRLSDAEIRDGLKSLDGWSIVDGQLRKTYVLKDFKEAMAFVTRVALIAEPMDHHPDIDIRYKKVQLSVLTHSAGALTEKDFNLARAIDN